MKKKIIEGIVTCNDCSNNDWSFETEEQSLSSNICSAIDEILDCETKKGEKFKITIERV